MKKQQNGFTVIEGILIVVILAIIGFAGWYVYKTQKGDDAEQANTVITPTSTPSISTTTEQVSEYLKIEEWGVKIPLSPIINDGKSLRNGTNSEDQSIYSLYKQSFADLSDSCIGLPSLSISRYNDPSLPVNMSDNSDSKTYHYYYGDSAIKIGNYWYYYVISQSSCGTTYPNPTELKPSEAEQSQATQAFIDAFKYIQAL